MGNKEPGNTAACMEEFALKGLDTFDKPDGHAQGLRNHR